MAYRLLVDIDNTLLRAIIDIGAEEGVPKVSAKKIALRCGVSTFTIFEHFGTMRNAIDNAAMLVDTPRMEKTEQIIGNGSSLMELWDYMLEDFILNPSDTLFYISYTNTYGFDPTVNNPRSAAFLEVARQIFVGKSYTDNQLLLMWDFITSMAFYYAEKIIRGYLKNDTETRKEATSLVFRGLNGFPEV